LSPQIDLCRLVFLACKFVIDNLKKYQKLVATNRKSLDTFLRRHDQHQRVVITSTESQGRHKKHYFLKLEALADEPEAGKAPALDPRYVQYRVKQLPCPAPWAKPFMALTLAGWRRGVLLAGIFALVIGLGGPIAHALIIKKMLV
jgi:hypothetical protein